MSYKKSLIAGSPSRSRDQALVYLIVMRFENLAASVEAHTAGVVRTHKYRVSPVYYFKR